MKKISFILTVLFTLALTACVHKTLITPSQSRVGYSAWNTQVSYTHCDPLPKTGKPELVSGSWEMNDGILQHKACEQAPLAICNYVIPSDHYTIQCTARKDVGPDGFIIVFNYVDAQNYCQLNYGCESNTKHAIEQISGDKRKRLATRPGSVETGKWYDVKLTVAGDTIKAWLDSELMFDEVLKMSDISKKDVHIAIAWRTDTDNEFCTNVVEAFREAGVSVAVLPQVKADYLDYNETAVATSNLDTEGIGYLNNASGTLVRSQGYVESNAADVLKNVDGVLFTGGEDIAPTLYAIQQDWHHIEAEIDYNAARDVSDFLTMTYCLDHDIPLLGFCRGAQMLGVVSGATVIQDIPTWFASHELPYNYEHRHEKVEGETYRDYTPHNVTLNSGSLLARYFGTASLTGCPSWHHQVLLSTEGTPLSVTATTTVSGIDMVEGVERTDKRCAVGVQFHPEAAIVKHIGKGVNNANAREFMSYDAAMPLLRAFIEECKKK